MNLKLYFPNQTKQILSTQNESHAFIRNTDKKRYSVLNRYSFNILGIL